MSRIVNDKSIIRLAFEPDHRSHQGAPETAGTIASRRSLVLRAAHPNPQLPQGGVLEPGHAPKLWPGFSLRKKKRPRLGPGPGGETTRGDPRAGDSTLNPSEKKEPLWAQRILRFDV
jgi:hypothetical protein